MSVFLCREKKINSPPHHGQKSTTLHKMLLYICPDLWGGLDG